MELTFLTHCFLVILHYTELHYIFIESRTEFSNWQRFTAFFFPGKILVVRYKVHGSHLAIFHYVSSSPPPPPPHPTPPPPHLLLLPLILLCKLRTGPMSLELFKFCVHWKFTTQASTVAYIQCRRLNVSSPRNPVVGLVLIFEVVVGEIDSNE